MKITTEDNELVIREIFNGILLKTPYGEKFSICMRDTGFEFKYNDIWYEAKYGKIKEL